MIIIGEKINGTIKSVAAAIKARDTKFIERLAMDQTKAGAHYLDVCAGTATDIETETLQWLVNTVQNAVNTPLCVDSPSPEVIEQVLPCVKNLGLINSVSEEGTKPAKIYPLAAQYGCSLIALAVNDNGIPKDVDTKVKIAESLINKAAEYGIEQERLFIDPLVLALSTDNLSLLHFMTTVKMIKSKFPNVKITSGLSNISFGMPLRKLVNRHFLSYAMYAGMDSAIMDPLDQALKGSLLASSALVGQDRNCRTFANAFRKGEIQ
jgi:5-methyltetrahydrofolate corrinoid/iron sulfur protein methyltransferase